MLSTIFEDQCPTLECSSGGEMKKILSKILIITLMTGAVVLCVGAQSTDRNVKVINKNTPTEVPGKTNSTPDELLALLPATNLIAVLDAKRGLNDTLPRLSSLSFGGVDKLAARIKEFLTTTGLDTSQVKNAVMGF